MNVMITAKNDNNPDSAIISVRDLHKEYKVSQQKVHALKGISFDIKKGEFVVVAAPSGSGKSTLLHIIGGLDKPSYGSVIVDGTDISMLSDHQLSEFRSQSIGFIFQFFYLQPFLRLTGNLEVPGMFSRLKTVDRAKRVSELAAAVGISDQLSHYPRELSGGQTQRAVIVRALLNNPKIILADEPTGNLDSENSTDVIDLFESIRQRYGTTVVIATHDQAVAEHADRVIKLESGRHLHD